LNRGDTYHYTGQDDMAMADYNKTIELNPKFGWAYYFRGQIYIDRGQYDLAIVDCSKLIELMPKYVGNYYRGFCYYKKGQYDMAIADFNKAIELNPHDALAYSFRGIAYFDKGQYDMAMADYNKAIEFDPEGYRAYYFRGFAYHNNKQYDLAITDYSKVLQLTTDPRIIDYVNEQLASLGQLTQTTSVPSALTLGTIPLTIDTRWQLYNAYIIVEIDGTIEYQVTPQTLMAYGGSPLARYTWSKAMGGRSFPPGITVDSHTGVLKGTGGVLVEGTYTFDVEVSDGSQTETVVFIIKVAKYVKQSGPFPDPGLAYIDFQQAGMPTISLVNGRAGQPYAASLYVAGGKPPYNWFINQTNQSSFTLSGLTVDMSGGIVRGTISPTMSGQTIEFSVTVKDSTGATAIFGPIYTIKVR